MNIYANSASSPLWLLRIRFINMVGKELFQKHFCKIFQNICSNTEINANSTFPIIKSEMRSFKSNENIHKKEGGSYYVVSANKASSVTL